jgi:hypothetical protein
MIKFCRSCGQEMSEPTEKTCPHCASNAIKATAFCRYCGHPTSVEDATCRHCGSSIKPLPSSIRTLFEYPRLSTRMGKIINLSIVAVLVVAYIVFTLPKSVTKPVKQAASNAVMANTGYTTMPLTGIEITPPLIPELMVYYFTYTPPGITVNSTRQITVYARYQSANSENGTKATRIVDITTNCTYQSSDEKVATCNASGVVRATGHGGANITAFYTAAPGSTNMSNAGGGKMPVTFTAKVLTLVR